MKQFKAKLSSARGGGHTLAIPPDVADAAGLAYGSRVRGSRARRIASTVASFEKK